MTAFLSKLWRVPATGFCFLAFFTGSILFRLLVFPSLNIFISDQRQRELRARKVVQASFSGFVRMMRFLQVLKLEVDPQLKKRLATESLFICASHPTLIDVVILHSLIEKRQLHRQGSICATSFALSSPVRAARLHCQRLGPRADRSLRSQPRLRQGDTLVVFPEGTRSVPGKDPRAASRRRSHRLSFRERNITPVCITCTPPALMKGIAWYQVPERKMSISVRAAPDIRIEPFYGS